MQRDPRYLQPQYVQHPVEYEITPQILDSAEGFFRSIPPRFWPEDHEFLLQVPLQFRLKLLKQIADAGGPVPDMEGLAWEIQAAIGYVPVAARRSTAPLVGPMPRAYYSSAPVPLQCTVNGFDNTWGTPPPSYLGVAMAFDSDVGVYRFNEVYALHNSIDPATGRPAYSLYDFNSIKSTYATGLFLQPYRVSFGSPWQFRWVGLSQTPVVKCKV